MRTVWEIVGQKRRSLSVGWWGSWPATGEPGGTSPWVVSDRVLAKLLSGAEFDRDTWPHNLFDRFEAGFETARETYRADFDAVFDGRPAGLEKLAWESFLIDAFHADVVAGLWDEAQLETAFVYLPGLEILRHRAESADAEITLMQKAAAFETYTRWLDARVAGLIESTGPGTTVLVVADPGRRGGAESEGFAVVRRTGLSGGCVEGPAGARIVAALALVLAGFPLSDELPGLDGLECLRPLAGSAGTIASYGERSIGPDDFSSAYDREMLERLRSLGYLN